ncbi:MAG: hypothetical protein BWY50_00160 [Spirochaetes bacterium ADurb.Bin315]|jgi:hypothetical protein|nr:MAG: hypothetical protein BWY50_00160 [Spirochaetes bacterium ADurb.Bin315]
MGRRKFERPRGERRYKKMFVISFEGTVTEPSYFRMLVPPKSPIILHCLKGSKKSSPGQVLKRMKQYIRYQNLSSSDEAWLVVDKDDWSDDQLSELYAWKSSSSQRGLAVSNPKFELWLLLHFEDPRSIFSSRDCSDRLKRYIPHYEKEIQKNTFSVSQINDAIERAKNRDNPPCVDWPRTLGKTTVYRLVNRIFEDIESVQERASKTTKGPEGP